MKAPRFLYSKTPSGCCDAKALVVRSRQGGFISQNCLKCGSSGYISAHELPDLECDSCGRILAIKNLDGQNYFYVCEHCGRHWKIGDTVPHWSELFAYSGLAVDSDLPMAEQRDQPHHT